MRFLPRPTLYKSTRDNPADPAKFLQNSPFHVERRPSAGHRQPAPPSANPF